MRKVSGFTGRIPKYRFGLYGPHVQVDTFASLARGQLGVSAAQTLQAASKRRTLVIIDAMLKLIRRGSADATCS
jgi:hypothetical protein